MVIEVVTAVGEAGKIGSEVEEIATTHPAELKNRIRGAELVSIVEVVVGAAEEDTSHAATPVCPPRIDSILEATILVRVGVVAEVPRMPAQETLVRHTCATALGAATECQSSKRRRRPEKLLRKSMIGNRPKARQKPKPGQLKTGRKSIKREKPRMLAIFEERLFAGQTRNHP